MKDETKQKEREEESESEESEESTDGEQYFESENETDDDELEEVVYPKDFWSKLGVDTKGDKNRSGSKDGLRRSTRLRQKYMNQNRPNYDENDVTMTQNN